MTMHLHPSQIEFWSLDRLKPYARNAKTHDVHQVAKIAASMAEFGWTAPCLVAADGELNAGHVGPDPVRRDQATVSGIAVNLREPTEALQYPFGMLSATAGGIGDRVVSVVVGTERVLVKGKWRSVEIRACPVTFRPDAQQIEAARRGYEDWWQALEWVRVGLIVGRMLQEVEVTAAMPKVRPWLVSPRKLH